VRLNAGLSAELTLKVNPNYQRSKEWKLATKKKNTKQKLLTQEENEKWRSKNSQTHRQVINYAPALVHT